MLFLEEFLEENHDEKQETKQQEEEGAEGARSVHSLQHGTQVVTCQTQLRVRGREERHLVQQDALNLLQLFRTQTVVTPILQHCVDRLLLLVGCFGPANEERGDVAGALSRRAATPDALPQLPDEVERLRGEG